MNKSIKYFSDQYIIRANKFVLAFEFLMGVIFIVGPIYLILTDNVRAYDGSFSWFLLGIDLIQLALGSWAFWHLYHDCRLKMVIDETGLYESKLNKKFTWEEIQLCRFELGHGENGFSPYELLIITTHGRWSIKHLMTYYPLALNFAFFIDFSQIDDLVEAIRHFSHQPHLIETPQKQGAANRKRAIWCGIGIILVLVVSILLKLFL